MRNYHLVSRRTPLLISFSGLDGSGKSKQIENLRHFVQSQGLTTQRLAFWDDVVVFTPYREGFVHKVYGSKRGVGASGRPVRRRDKNVRKWYLSILRHGLYLLDAVNLIRVPGKARCSSTDVIIMESLSLRRVCQSTSGECRDEELRSRPEPLHSQARSSLSPGRRPTDGISPQAGVSRGIYALVRPRLLRSRGHSRQYDRDTASSAPRGEARSGSCTHFCTAEPT
jgi:hypothetical protein